MQEDGCYKGFKPRQYYEFGDGVKDQIEQFNWSRDMSHADEFPSAMHPFLDEVRAFTDKVHNHVLLNLLRRESSAEPPDAGQCLRSLLSCRPRLSSISTSLMSTTSRGSAVRLPWSSPRVRLM